jgi:hypothetical protein
MQKRCHRAAGAIHKIINNQRLEECSMLRKSLIGTAIFAALTASAFGQAQYGTADEAKAMLLKAVAAVKVDKTKALDMFNKGEGGFLDR